MFLDDELLKMVTDSEIDTTEDLQKLYKDVCNKCQDYYKSKIDPHKISAKELKAVINRTFRLYDSFVRMAKTHKDEPVRILGKMFEMYPFKDQFMKDTELAKIYNSL